MMEDSEKMTALKRAYADMILNMAKESAGRILELDRRAIRLQHGMFLTKEDALSMLLRLKSTMDSKIKEAEKANLGQVRKIQELEGRLNEAKDTIDYLRSELKIAKTELENKKNTQAKLLDEQSADGATYDKDNCQDCKSTSHSLPCSKNGSSNVPTSDTNCTALKDLTALNKSAGSHDLASFILSSKESELYRNGCTQRIRAFEQNLLTGREQPGQSVDWLSISKNETTLCKNGHAERPKNVDLALGGKTVNQAGNPFESKEVTCQASSSVNGQALEFFCGLSSIKQRTRQKLMAKCTTHGTYHEKADCEPYGVDYLRTLSSITQRARGKLVKKSASCGTSYGKSGHGSSDINCSKIAGKNNLTKSCETLHRAVSKAPQKTQSSCMAHLSTGNSKTSKDSEINSSRLLNNEKPELLNGNSTIMTGITVTKHNWHSMNQICRSLQSRIGHTGPENSVRVPPLLSTTNTNDDYAKDSLPTDCSKLMTSDHGVALDLDVSMHEKKMTHGTGDALLENPDLNDERTFRLSGPAEAGSDRILKTFERKRKRESLASKNETVSIEKKNASEGMDDKQIALLEPQKPSLVRESSRDSRRVAQVARQLIALSRKRW